LMSVRLGITLSLMSFVFPIYSMGGGATVRAATRIHAAALPRLASINAVKRSNR